VHNIDRQVIVAFAWSYSMSNNPDFFSTLLGGQGCSSDGTASNNPITAFVDQILNSHIPDSSHQALLSEGDNSQSIELQLNEQTHAGAAELGHEGHVNNVWSSQYGVNNPDSAMGLQDPYMMQAMQQQYMMQMQMQMQQQIHMQELHRYNLQIQHGGTSSSASSAVPQEAVNRRSSLEDAEMEEEGAFRRYVEELRQGLQEDGADAEALVGATDDFSDDYDQLLAPSGTPGYEFASTVDTNRFREEPEGSAFQAGVKLYARGDIAGAIEAFEMELLRDRGNDECWKYLGLCQAENDSDLQAIQCFTHSIENDPFNLDSLLLLGTAYTNELENSKALACIRQWVSHNPDFRGVSSSVQTDLESHDPYGDGSVLDRTIQLMQAVCEQVESDSSGVHGEVAAQVYSLLGVLYNVSQDFTAAARSFASAVAAAPMNYSLHNKVC
jgi:tetratricopeptide (TPR) repeat protein